MSRFSPFALHTAYPALEEALEAAARDLETALSGEVAAAASAAAELQRVHGVLDMLGLPGVAVFAAELHAQLQQLTDPQAASSLRPAALHGALAALRRYLDDLMHGAADAAVRLFPEYRAMLQARGVELAFETDLFFPPLEVELPAEVLQGGVAEAVRSAELKAARSHFQQGLLQWLRASQPEQALVAMRAALVRVRKALPADGSRGYWWVAEGLLEALAEGAIPADPSVRKLLRQLDFHIKALLDGQTPDCARDQREMLYLLGHCTAAGNVARIKESYALARYLPAPGTLQLGMLGQRLAAMQQQLTAASMSWERCQGGAPEAEQEFLHLCRELSASAALLEADTLQPLCAIIVETAEAALAQGKAVVLGQELALALLLLQQGLSSYQSLDGEFHAQVRLMGERLQQTLAGGSPSPTQEARLVERFCRMERSTVCALLAAELQRGLQQVEVALQACFDNAGECAGLAQSERRLAETEGALLVLGQDAAARLAAALRAAVRGVAQRGHPLGNEPTALAMALSVLLQAVAALPGGTGVADEMVQQACAGLEAMGGAPPMAEAPEPAPVSAADASLSDEEQGLLEVFLEEAREVLHSLRQQLTQRPAAGNEREALSVMRRGFHTLKGSGRMVGLLELGETAWAVERALNHRLQQERPMDQSVLELIRQAAELFSHWVEALSAGRQATPDTAALLALAAAVEHDQPLPEAGSRSSAKEAMQPLPVPATPRVQPETAESQVVIGTVSLSPTLFAIATQEAASHVRALQQQLEQARAAMPLQIDHDFMRAAHTLVGVNRTMGFTAVAELAYALEQWLDERVGKAVQPEPEQIDLLTTSVAALDAMCAAVRARREPQPQPELIARLMQEKNRYRLVEQELPAVFPAVPTAQSTGAAVLDEVDAQLLPVFLEEADELNSQITAALRMWRAAPQEAQHGHRLQRLLHTLKGSARMAGALHLGDLVHEVEGRVEAVQHGAPSSPSWWEEVNEALDRIAQAIDALRQPGAASTVATAAAMPPQPQAAGALRVHAEVVDRLVNEAGEISVARARAETELAEIRNGLLELTDSVDRLLRQLREIEIQAEGRMQAQVSGGGASHERFDPLEFDRFTRFQELTRFVNESVHDVQTIQQTMLKNLGDAAAALSAQALRNRELQQELLALRMVPFASSAERLYRIVRQTAKELGKRAHLELRGGEVELDRSVLERITAPLEHLLRNAVAHGLENAEQRAAAGKAPIGEIHLVLQQVGNEVVFELSDDGAGLDLARLRQRGEALGLLQAGEEVGEEQLMQLIFAPGLSTAERVSEIAGRGVGLDVVRSEINALGGRIDVASVAGQGTRFTLYLPLTLAMARVLVVRQGNIEYALPTALVEQVQQLKPTALEEGYHIGQLHWQGRSYPLFHLARLLGKEEGELVVRPHNPVLLLHSGAQRLALHVDELCGNREVVVKNIGPQLARLPGIVGATVAGDGSVMLILNPLLLAQRTARVGSARPMSQEAVRQVPVVMVVDDSLTVRKITGKLLQRAGYQVLTAKDGLDALEQMMDVRPALVLLDLEMPRMDGFELAQRLRQEARTRDLPIIMITSRTADKHRDYALNLGVNAYLGKPYQEEVLLAEIRRHLAV